MQKFADNDPIRPYRLLSSAMLRLLRWPIDKPNILILARKHRPHHAVAPISRMTASVGHVASDPSDAPTPLHSTTRQGALKPIRSQRLLRSVAATFLGTTSVSHLALDRLDVMKSRNRPFLQLRQPSTSEDPSVAGLGRVLENHAVLELFTTEAAKHRACVDTAEMLHTVSGGVFRTVLKQLPDFCVALNSLTTEYAKPLAFMDTIFGGGPHSKPWKDHEKLEESEKESMNDLVNSPLFLRSLTKYALPINLHVLSLDHHSSTSYPATSMFSTDPIECRPSADSKCDQLLLEGVLVQEAMN